MLNDTWLSNYYADSVGNDTDHFGNVVKNLRARVTFAQRQFMSNSVIGTESHILLGKRTESKLTDPHGWARGDVVNVHAHMLGAPFFSHDLPVSINFGALGLLVGHELFHLVIDSAFSLEFSNDTINAIANQSQCADDVGVYLKHRTNYKREENTADIGGARQAYRAYRNWLLSKNDNNNNSQPLMRLYGMEQLTDEQLFFISGALMWCHGMPPKFTKWMAHTSAQYKTRAIRAYVNIPEFFVAFNCSANSKVNKITKCQVW